VLIFNSLKEIAKQQHSCLPAFSRCYLGYQGFHSEGYYRCIASIALGDPGSNRPDGRSRLNKMVPDHFKKSGEFGGGFCEAGDKHKVGMAVFGVLVG